MKISFALQTGDRYKIIIGMDVLSQYKAQLDFAAESLKFKIKEDKVNLKLTQRKVIWKSKQLKEYFDYVRKGRQIVKEANEVEEEDEEHVQDHSCFEIDELTAQYVGEELTHIAALAELPPGLPDTPLDHDPPAAAPSFAVTCQLAEALVGKEVSGGALLNFKVDGEDVCAVAENHAVADVDVLFHADGEECASKHAHKVGVDAAHAKLKVKASVLEMAQLSKQLKSKESNVAIRNAAVHSLLTVDNDPKVLASCDEVS